MKQWIETGRSCGTCNNFRMHDWMDYCDIQSSTFGLGWRVSTSLDSFHCRDYQNRRPLSETRLLVACEYSGVIRDAFSNAGWDAWSCDLQQTESEQTAKEMKHYQCDVRDILYKDWDLLIAHPPCTRLNIRGEYWTQKRSLYDEKQKAIDFFMLFVKSEIRHKAIENPVGIMSTNYRKPDQIIQPFYFGDGEQKATCLWLYKLPLLEYDFQDNLFGYKTTVEPNIRVTPSGYRYTFADAQMGKDRAKKRSKTFQGVANAMAEQWTEYFQRIGLI